VTFVEEITPKVIVLIRISQLKKKCSTWAITKDKLVSLTNRWRHNPNQGFGWKQEVGPSNRQAQYQQ